MNLYFLPPNESGLKDHVFDHWSHEDRGGISSEFAWDNFKKSFEKQGYTVHTTDFWHPEIAKPDDILFVHQHPEDSPLMRLSYALRSNRTFMLTRRKFLYDNYVFFLRRILFHTESPIATPHVYKHADKILTSGVYTKIFFNAHISGTKYFCHYFYRDRNIISPHFSEPKQKYLVMVNGNITPHTLFDNKELYGERWQALRYFSEKSGLDLFGRDWDKMPRHPWYLRYGKYARKVWRGSIEDKMQKLAEYKFCICFENYRYPGYVSEKIFDCLASGCIPIYLGAPDITSIVPASCFIDFRKFKNYDELNHYLTSLTPSDLKKYRDSISAFLSDESNMRGMGAFADEILS